MAVASASVEDRMRTVLDRLVGVERTDVDQYMARCPAHDDSKASLAVNKASSLILLHCHAGCHRLEVLTKIGLDESILFPPSGQQAGESSEHIVAEYNYVDASGKLSYQVVRMLPKDFRQRRPNGAGGWLWNSKGIRPLPYRLPELLAADLSGIVFVAEGEKAVDALREIGFVATCSHGGAGKWRPSHAEWLKGRRVVILPDRDAPGQKHALTVAKSLKGVATSIKIIELPNLADKADPFDWIRDGGSREQLLALVDAAPECTADQIAESIASDDVGFVKIVADLICADNHFARDGGGKLFRFSDGAYRSRAEAFIRAEVKRLCVALESTDEWSTRFSNEVVEFISVDAPELWERPLIDVVNVRNGLLRLADGVLLPHSHEHLSSVQLPVEYDPAATCPAIDEFVSEVFPSDAVDLAFEVPAWLMTPDTSIQKAILLLGAGGNGKSTYLAAVISFLGRSNCTGLSLHKIESNRFAVGRLVGKLANICPDLPTEHLSGTSVFKSITGTDFGLEGEYKFRDGFSFDPFCRLVFSANSPPRSSDASEGFFDRWLVVPFDARFRGSSREITRKELDARLSAPGEMSGLLNKAVAAWRAIQGRGGRLSEPASVRAAWAEFHAATDPLSVWLDRFTVDDPGGLVPKQVLRAAYGAACEQGGRPTLTDAAFGLAIKKVRPSVTTAQRTVNGRVQWCYVGIGLHGDATDTSHTSQGSQGSFTLSHARAREVKQEVEGGVEDEIKWANPVNPVNHVNGSAACKHEWQDSVDADRPGWLRTACCLCGAWRGHRPADPIAPAA